jgi:hypothetical protein
MAVLSLSGAAASQAGQGTSTRKLPSVIAKAVGNVPFSFLYGGRPSSEILPQWDQERKTQALPGDREHRVLTYRDPRTGLEIINESTVYNSLQAVDWVVRLRNTGSVDTPILENLRALDLGFRPSGSGAILLHQASGSVVSHLAEDFMPLEARVAPGGAFTMVHYDMKGAEHVGGQLPSGGGGTSGDGGREYAAGLGGVPPPGLNRRCGTLPQGGRSREHALPHQDRAGSGADRSPGWLGA